MTTSLTQTGTRPHRWRRSVGSVLAGLIAIVVLSVGTDTLLHATGVYPRWFQPMSAPLWVLATAYRVVYGIAGGYVTARLAPDRPMHHALALGVIGVVLSTVGAVVNWNKGAAYGPHWYPIALIAISLPSCWVGGMMWLTRRYVGEIGPVNVR
jgi:hypothetical protein